MAKAGLIPRFFCLVGRLIPSPPPSVRLLGMITGAWSTQAVHAAAKLGLADLLRDGPRTAEDLASMTGSHPPSLYRLLRALSSLGLFTENEGRRFALAPLGQPLRSDVPGSLRAGAIFMGEGFYWQAWGGLERSLATGESAFEAVHGRRLFEYLSASPGARELFHAWMSEISEVSIPALLASYDFSGLRRIVDVGGGQGRLLAAILKANPYATGVLFDLPESLAGPLWPSKEGVGARCEVVAGDFFEEVPADGDIYLFKIVLHDWSDDLALKILENTRRAMAPGARILVMEALVPEGGEPGYGKLADLEMLVLNHGGRERTESEFRDLVAAAGLRLSRTIRTRSPLAILEAVAASPS